MASDAQLYFKVGNLTSLGGPDLNTDSADPLYRPGAINMSVDAYGWRVFKYVKNISNSAVARGETLSYAADGANVMTTTVSNITAGSTTSATTTGLTADDHDGKILFVLDKDATAGAAPEGECSIISDNTATIISLEDNYALSVALAVNDDLEMITNWQVNDAADGDEAWTVAGVVIGNDGFADNNYGWVQIEGPCSVDVTTNAITEGDPIVTGAAIMDAFGTDGHELWCGVALATGSTDEAIPTIPAYLKLMTFENTGGTP